MIQISQVYANDSNSLKFIERIYTESFPLDERRDFSEVIRLLEENVLPHGIFLYKNNIMLLRNHLFVGF